MSQGQVKHPESDGRLKDNKDMPSNNRAGGKHANQYTKRDRK